MNELAKHFLLNPDITFLNHGSFGAVPKPVFAVYQSWQRELEYQPIEFLSRRNSELLYQSRLELANYLHTQPQKLVFVPNTTTGINIIARSLHLLPDNEVLSTDHEYGALERAWRFNSKKSGFTYRRVNIPIPFGNDDFLVEQFWSAVTPATKVIFMSHITSQTACIFPVKAICSKARQAGILTIIDGAHAPSQLDLDLEDLGADLYVGNLHKWLCAPKGSAFLYAREEVQDLIEPLVTSWGWESDHPGLSRFNDYLEWTGTMDISAYLTVPAAIQFQQEHNWQELRINSHNLALDCLNRINQLTSCDSIYTQSSQFAQMVSIRLPDLNVEELKIKLYDLYKIEVPVFLWNSNPYIRVSFQAYNDDRDLNVLIYALGQILAK